MLTATLLALGAAVLHAGWNLLIKQGGDRWIALWGQFFAGGLLCLAGLGAASALGHPLPASAWGWAGLSGLTHIPYCWFLARAYDHGDFSLVYPMARGGGAMLAAVGGVALLGDQLNPLSAAAIACVGLGLFLLAGRATGTGVQAALVVAAAIGTYSVIDARGIRATGTPLYALATLTATAVTTSSFGIVTGRRREMAVAMRAGWRRFALIGAASAVTYGMVQLAFRRAPVGYVTALRESSVVLAAFAGVRLLGEPAGRRRIGASMVVVSGLLLLVAAR